MIKFFETIQKIRNKLDIRLENYSPKRKNIACQVKQNPSKKCGIYKLKIKKQSLGEKLN